MLVNAGRGFMVLVLILPFLDRQDKLLICLGRGSSVGLPATVNLGCGSNPGVTSRATRPSSIAVPVNLGRDLALALNNFAILGRTRPGYGKAVDLSPVLQIGLKGVEGLVWLPQSVARRRVQKRLAG